APPPRPTLFPYTTLFRSQHNVAGEFGHMTLNIEGPRCACGANGCWEAYVSNLATLSRYFGRNLAEEQPLPLESARLTIDDLVARSEEHTSELQSRSDLVC